MNTSIHDLLNMTNVNIIDIRSIEKYNDNHIDNARHIPMILLLKDPDKYLNKNDDYYIYCQYGKSSYKVCLALARQGYKVHNILGGYEAWLLAK